MTLEQIARLYVIFKTLQPEIKEWIASDDTAAIIQAIAARFVLSDEQEQKLPILILRLVTQDLPPESFKAELAKDVGVDEGLAKNITEALVKEVITPIGAALRYGGVDTNLVGFNSPAPRSPNEALAKLGSPQSEVVPPPSTPVKIIEPSVASPSKPFILHEEPQKTAVTPNASQSFTYAPQLGEVADGKIPPRVVIERVVHYSELRTPLNIATTHKDALNPERVKSRIPESKWFA